MLTRRSKIKDVVCARDRFFDSRTARTLDFLLIHSDGKSREYRGACSRSRSKCRGNSARTRGNEAVKRVVRIFPDCTRTTTVVVCGYVNRSQSKYICTHRCNAARGGARSADRDAIVPRASCLARFRHSLCPALCTKCGNECRGIKLMRFDSQTNIAPLDRLFCYLVLQPGRSISIVGAVQADRAEKREREREREVVEEEMSCIARTAAGIFRDSPRTNTQIR